MMATSGAELLPSTAVRELRRCLLPQTTILTPNIPEARLLLLNAGLPPVDIQNIAGLEAAAKDLRHLVPGWVLLKGGHLPLTADYVVAKHDSERRIVVDILVGPGQHVSRIEAPYQASENTHGTGCSLACKFRLARVDRVAN